MANRATQGPSILLALPCLLAACGEQAESPPVDRLAAAGLYRYAEPAQMSKLQERVARGGWSRVIADTGRAVRVDAQALAEGGVGKVLDDLRPFLERQQVKLEPVEETLEEDVYTVTVNGKTREIWNTAEKQKEEHDELRGLMWGVSVARTFKIVNDLLQQASSRERLYAVGGGHDVLAIFLTPQLWQLLQEKVPPRGKPYVPTEEHPYFGQPH